MMLYSLEELSNFTAQYKITEKLRAFIAKSQV